jgi:4-hydroxybenzoate polyprenyltransferase
MMGSALATLIRTGSRIKPAWQAMRPHQWAKNTLVFVPMILGGALDARTILATALAFAALSLVASATYLVNDLLDLEDDRRHWTKRDRPLASGALPLVQGIGLAALLLAGGLGLGASAGWTTLLGLIAYALGTIAYSLRLKRVPVLDVLVLAGLFTLRLVIGVAASGVALSPWLLTFSMFLFLSLSLAKRHTELARAAGLGEAPPSGRGYVMKDEPVVLALGVGALVAGILVFVLYLTQEAFAAAHLAWPKLLWAFPPGLFLLGARIWLLSGRGELADDPVAFFLKDRISLVILAALALVFVISWLGPNIP